MKALLCHSFSGIEQLTVEETPAPRPKSNQVLIDVQCASLNYPDALMVQGRYQTKPPFPFSPGMDLTGIVLAVGDGVDHVEVGDRVVAFPGHGAFAEQCVASKAKVYRLPEEIPFEVGAAFGLTYATVIHAFTQCAPLKAQERVLVLGGAGGVGLAAIEVAQVMGARVIAAAGSAEKLTACREAGAEMTINYNSEDLRQRALDLTDGLGIETICDPVGGDYTVNAFRALAWGGRLLVIGFAAGVIPKLPLNLALLSERSIIGVYWGAWAERDPAGHRGNMDQLARWYREGKINPLISERIALDQVPQAMQQLMARRVKGKIVVRVQK